MAQVESKPNSFEFAETQPIEAVIYYRKISVIEHHTKRHKKGSPIVVR
jgi:hypothetical protein